MFIRCCLFSNRLKHEQLVARSLARGINELQLLKTRENMKYLLSVVLLRNEHVYINKGIEEDSGRNVHQTQFTALKTRSTECTE